jgi:hypothetical protein
VDKICERAVRYFADPHRKVQHMHSQRTIVLVAGLVFFARNMWTQESNAQHSQAVEVGPREANDTNAANNPIHPLLTVDLQNYFAPSPKGFSGRIGNQGLLRVSVPIRAFGTRQIVRTILPINTTASMQGGPNTGAGDLTVYDFLLFQEHRSTLGIGPLIAAPTARGEAYGSGKWQAGAAGIVIAPHNWGLLAVLATYQHSFSGNSSSPVGQLTSVQPFFIDNFPHGFYFRSTGVWTFDTFHHVQDIPLGFGIGKVWKRSNGDIANLYIEPQYSVFQSGVGSPKWQVFAGATFKFPTGKRRKEQ